jgi:hypothetical protein
MEKQGAGEDVPADDQIDSQDEQRRRQSVFRRDGQDEQDADGKPGPNGSPSIPAPAAGNESIASVLKNVAATLEAEPEGEPQDDAPVSDGESTLPTNPRTLAEVGLSKAFLTDLTLKIMHYSGTPSAAQLMRRLGLGQNMVQQVLSALQEDRLCEVLSQSDLFTGNYRYRLSERGTARASEALERTRYAGPVPVTAEQYSEVIRAQNAARQTLSPASINATLDEYVLAPDVKDAVARALYSGKTTLFHGASGNGKTSILERFAGSLSGTALVPYAIYAYGQVIRVFDPSIHEPVEDLDDSNAVKDDARLDRRWVLVRRPAVILGSELGPESLDLAYDPQSRFYQAPPHIKAQGGALVVDDLGRQRTESRELLTRWLITVERGWDSLSMITGEKLTVPFDVQLLFGTNRPIDELADDALLRRILYKVEIPSPGPAEFAEILRRLCRDRNVQATDGTVDQVVERLYRQLKEPPRAAYARDLLEMVVEGAAYDGREPCLDEESFERALKLFLSQREGSV